MSSLFILNDPPYGTERVFNGLRLATNLQKRDPGHEVIIFLLGDAVTAARSGQSTPDGYYTLDRMLGVVIRNGGIVLVCGTCMDARGLADDDLIPGAARSTMDALTDATLAAAKVLVF
jgi:uncharacterized protein involved in oxidation of intracellular sulfur